MVGRYCDIWLRLWSQRNRVSSLARHRGSVLLPGRMRPLICPRLSDRDGVEKSQQPAVAEQTFVDGFLTDDLVTRVSALGSISDGHAG